MLVKIILVFLLVIVLLGMVGKLLFPDRMPRLQVRRCTTCGRPRVGRGACACGAKK